MKKFAVFFFLLFFAFTAESFAVSDAVKKQIEENVLPRLKDNNILVESVDFSTADVVKLKGLTAKDFFIPGSSIKIAELILTDVNEDIFTAKPDQLPLIAQKIELVNANIAFTLKGEAFTVSIGQTLLNNYKQNLIYLLEKGLDRKTVIGGLMRYTADAIVYNNIKMEQIKTGDKSNLTVTAKNMAANDISLEKMKSFKISDIQFLLNEGPNDSATMTVGSLAALDIGIPSGEYTFFLINNIENIINEKLSPEQAKEYAKLNQEYNIANNSIKLKIENFAYENNITKSKPVSFEEVLFDINVDTKTNAKFDFSLLFNGSKLDYKAMGIEESVLIPLFKTANPTLDLALQTTFKSDGDLSNVTFYAIDANDGPAVKVEGKFLFPKANLTELFSDPANEEKITAFFLQGKFAEFSIESDALDVQMPNTPRSVLKLDGLKALLKYDYNSASHASLGVDVPGLTLDMAQFMPPNDVNMAKALLNSDLFMLISNLKVNMATDGSASTLEYSAKVKDTANIDTKLDFIMPTVKISDVISIPPDQNKIQSFLASAQISGLQVIYEDAGLASRGLKMFSSMQGAEPKQVLNSLMPHLVQQLEAQKALLTPTSIEAATLCIKKPGKLTLTASTKRPIPANPSAMISLMDPNTISYDIKCEAGKDIAKASDDAPVSVASSPETQKKN